MDHALNIIKNDELISRIKLLVKEERRIQVEFLLHLKEIESRRLFLELGYSSLFDFVIKDLGYSESAGYRRIQAMRLLKTVPTIEQKICDGSFSLTAAAQIQTFIKQEEKQNGPVDKSIKADLVATLENKSSREIEKHLLSLRPIELIANEKVRQVTDTYTEIKLVVPDELKQKLDQLKFLLSHVNPEMNYQDLISYLADKAFNQLTHKTFESKKSASSEMTLKKTAEVENAKLVQHTKNKRDKKNDDDKSSNNKNDDDKNRPDKRTLNKAQEVLLSAPEVKFKNAHPSDSAKLRKLSNSRYICKKIKFEVWRRDQGCCTFVSGKTGIACNSKFQLQIDHIQPFSLGGKTELSNLRLLCGQHNRWRNQFMK